MDRTVPPTTQAAATEAPVEDLRLGETVLLAILTLGEAGVRSAGPVGLEVTIRALKLVGLHGEARLLALEAAIAAGI